MDMNLVFRDVHGEQLDLSPHSLCKPLPTLSQHSFHDLFCESSGKQVSVPEVGEMRFDIQGQEWHLGKL
jgi:hypothetical protein